MAFSPTILWLGCLSLGIVSLARSATESTTMTSAKTSHETPAVDLGALFDAREGAVVTLVAGDTRLAAHRAVLTARSPVFKAMLSNNTNSSSVVIADVDGPVLRQLLVYFYTLQAPQMSGMTPQLLVAADKYGVSGLKVCKQQLVAQLTVENAASLAVLALRHNCRRLKEASVAFIRDNFANVVATRAWRDAVASHPEDVMDIVQLIPETPADMSTAATTDGGSTPEPQPVASKPATAASSTLMPGRDAVSSYSTPAATDGGSAPGQTHSGNSQTPVASTPAPPACKAFLPDDDRDSRYRSLSAQEKGWRLRKAAENGAVAEVRALLAAGADVGARDRAFYKYTALHWAAFSGHVDVARWLLDCGADVNARSSGQRTPLHTAAAKGHTAVVRLLLAAAADLNARDEVGRTPLHYAAGTRHAEGVAALLEAGADTWIKDNTCRTAWDLAVTQQIRQLIEASSP